MSFSHAGLRNDALRVTLPGPYSWRADEA